MTNLDAFVYADSGEIQIPEDSFVAIVPPGITGSEQLLQALDEQLQFPDYFGANWNALEECLRDFHWISERAIILIHEDLPKLSDADLAVYIDILGTCVRDWNPGEGHQLIVIFSKGNRPKLEQISDRSPGYEN